MDNKLQIYPVNKFCMPLVYYYGYANKPISYYVGESSPLVGNDVNTILNINNSLGTIKSIENISIDDKIIFNDLGYDNDPNLEKKFKSFTTNHTEVLVSRLSETNYVETELVKEVCNNLMSLNCKFSESIEPIVIAISGLYGSLYTSLIAATLKAKLEKGGNRVLMLSDHFSVKSISVPLFGEKFHSLKTISIDEIYKLNVKLRAGEMVVKPDFIIMDIPGGLMRADEFFMNDFGIPLWTTMQAIKPDFYFNVVPASHYGKDYRKITNGYLSKTFDLEVDFYFLTNESYQFEPTLTHTLPDLELPNMRDEIYLIDKDDFTNAVYIDDLNSLKLDSYIKEMVSYKLDCI